MRLLACLAAAMACASAHAQQPPAERPRDEPAKVESLEVTQKRTTTTERRDATAAKIVIGRDEIEQYGDTNLGDVMRRLPGVTQGGRPGRGGPVRMRGMAGGFTQILLNGERIPPGFSIEEITPDQVERIEILRAPTAETGARAIAGTINIVLREALRSRHHDLRIGTQLENGRFASNGSVTRNGTFSEAGSYNLTLSVNRRSREDETLEERTAAALPSEALTLDQRTTGTSVSRGDHLFMTSRFQWRLGPGEQASFQPFVVAHENESASRGRLDQPVGEAPYATSNGRSDSRFRAARFMTMLTRRLGPGTTTELRAGAGTFTVDGTSRLEQFDATGARALLQETVTDVRDRSWNAAAKLARNWGETHKATAGVEWEGTRRREAPVTRLDGVDPLAEFGADFDAGVRRNALYLQDEWDPGPNWATSLGVRVEEIVTRSDTPANPVRNRSLVTSPLAHAVWRWDAPKRDQVRASLTQSYRPPTTQNLVARPRLSTLYPVPGTNTAVSPDAAGNPGLKPEIAHGLELAFERYLPMNGVVSVNLFTRRLKDVIRSVTELEQVSWAPVPRWVSRPQNLGRARTSGVEFDAKFRMDEVLPGSPAVNVRANVSVFRSRVDEVPGPDNRLASQPDMTANLGADYRFRGRPFSVGASLNWTPAYDTRATVEQLERTDRKSVLDAYAIWHIDGATRLRLSVTSPEPREFNTFSSYTTAQERQVLASTARNHLTTALRLEMRL